MTLPIGEYLRQWIELSTTEGQRGRRPLLLPPGRKCCPCCNGLALFGQRRGQAVCEPLNTSLHASEAGRDIHTFMDKKVTESMCKAGGDGCPIREAGRNARPRKGENDA